MERETEKQAIDRRAFLRTASLGAGVAAAAAVTGSAAQAAVSEPVTDEAGYRESEHVRRYYDLAAKF